MLKRAALLLDKSTNGIFGRIAGIAGESGEILASHCNAVDRVLRSDPVKILARILIRLDVFRVFQ